MLKDQIAEDIAQVFLDLDEFAELRTVCYDGETYQDIPVMLEGPTTDARPHRQDDRTQGLYQGGAVLYCAAQALGGKLPRQGYPLQINNCEGGGGFFRKFFVTCAAREMGMLRIELEAVRD